MTRNQKSKPAATHRPRGGTLVGVFIGLVLGVIAALAIALYVNRAEMPFLKPAKPDRLVEGKAEAPKTVTASAHPAPLPGKPGDKPLDKPRFDFYKILPEDGEAGASAQPVAIAPSPPPAEQLFLQAGAFQEPTDADNLKARLALMGIEAGVQQVILADKGPLHRVRIGPFGKPEEMAKVRSQLAQSGIQANVVKGGAN